MEIKKVIEWKERINEITFFFNAPVLGSTGQKNISILIFVSTLCALYKLGLITIENAQFHGITFNLLKSPLLLPLLYVCFIASLLITYNRARLDYLNWKRLAVVNHLKTKQLTLEITTESKRAYDIFDERAKNCQSITQKYTSEYEKLLIIRQEMYVKKFDIENKLTFSMLDKTMLEKQREDISKSISKNEAESEKVALKIKETSDTFDNATSIYYETQQNIGPNLDGLMFSVKKANKKLFNFFFQELSFAIVTSLAAIYYLAIA
ncbi:hypothetical protein [Pantoea sp. GL120224-02]|uniref:hypothetical protein n=1 Tax=Pantoea sp. GL120224-02 TaxID=1378084 RepID=UPI000BDB6E5F|nr:hypothetical protein [Pantoea sp. GL120224-02]SNY71019.1 hypothetical protein SAMN02744778_03127 [Pantoea sp. GL120224-02]